MKILQEEETTFGSQNSIAKEMKMTFWNVNSKTLNMVLAVMNIDETTTITIMIFTIKGLQLSVNLEL